MIGWQYMRADFRQFDRHFVTLQSPMNHHIKVLKTKRNKRTKKVKRAYHTGKAIWEKIHTTYARRVPERAIEKGMEMYVLYTHIERAIISLNSCKIKIMMCVHARVRVCWQTSQSKCKSTCKWTLLFQFTLTFTFTHINTTNVHFYLS